MGPKSIRFRIPTLNRPASPVLRDYDIDAFVDKVPTIIVSHFCQEDEDRRRKREDEEAIIESLSNFFKRVEKDKEKDNEEDNKGLDLRVPDTTNKVDDEFANFVQHCQSMMEEVRRIKNREPIKDFLDSIPPKEIKKEDETKKKRKRRRKKKKKVIDYVRKNRIRRFVYDKNVKYHRRCCEKSVDEIRNSLTGFRFQNRISMGETGSGEIEVVEVGSEKGVDLRSIYEAYLRRERRRTKRRCKLEIVARKLFTSADDEDGGKRQEHEITRQTLEKRKTRLSPALIQKLILKGKSMRTKRNLAKEEEMSFEHEDTPESISAEESKRENKEDDVLEMMPETTLAILWEDRLSGHQAFNSLAVTTFDGCGERLLLGHIRIPSSMPSRCLCQAHRREDSVRLLHWGRPKLRAAEAEAEVARKKAEEAAVAAAKELGRRPSGLDFIRGLMNNPFNSWSALTAASPALSTSAYWTATNEGNKIIDPRQTLFKKKRNRKWIEIKFRPDLPRKEIGDDDDYHHLESNTQVGASSEVKEISESQSCLAEMEKKEEEAAKGRESKMIPPSTVEKMSEKTLEEHLETTHQEEQEKQVDAATMRSIVSQTFGKDISRGVKAEIEEMERELEVKVNKGILVYHDDDDDDFWLHLPRTFSHQSSRFELPPDLSLLSGMTPLDYLESYVVISSARKVLYEKVFNRHRSLREGTLNIETVIKALEEVMGDKLTQSQQRQLWEDYLGVRPSFLLSFSLEQFSGLASFVERALSRELAGRHRFGGRMIAAVKKSRSEIEVADFDRLFSKMEDAGIKQGAMRNLLVAIKGDYDGRYDDHLR